MKPLALTREQYTTLWNQLDEDHLLEIAEADEFYEEMMGFIYDLEMAVAAGDGVAHFDITWDVADAIACEECEAAPIFSAHMFRILGNEFKNESLTPA